MTASGCSPGMFFGGSVDEGIANTKSYRQINFKCSGLDLSSSEVDVPTFRKLVGCFNANGGLDPIEKLLNRLSDADVQPLVDVQNHYVLNNRKLLYTLEQTYVTLSENQIIDPTFAQFGRLLENEEFISSSIALLKEGYSTSGAGGLPSWGISPDRKLLKAMEHLATKVNAGNAADALDIAMTFARAQAAQSLQARFRGDSPSGRRLRDLTDGLQAFLKETNDPKHVEVGRALIGEVVSGRLFQALDLMMGVSTEGLRTSIPRMSGSLKVLTANQASIMDGMTSLFHYLHVPLKCMKGSQTVPDGTRHVIQELMLKSTPEAASYIKREGILTLMAMAPFCEFPAELGRYYPSMFALADTTALEPSIDLVRSFFQVQDDKGARPLIDLLVNMLADTGSSYAGGPAENSAGLKLALPTLAELGERGAWDEVMILASMPRIADRGHIQSALKFLLEPIPGLASGESVYDVLTQAVSRTTPGDLYNFVYSLRRFVNDDQPMLDPAITALRHAFHANDVHPVIDLAQKILADASQNDRLFNTMFLIAEMPEFQASVKLVSEMSKDGRLKELLGSILTLFHKFALQGKIDIHTPGEPRFEPLWRHNFGVRDLNPFVIGPEPAVSNEACRKLDPRVSLGDYTSPDFIPQLDLFAACTNADGRHADVVDAIDTLKRQKTENGKSLLDLSIDLMKELELDAQELGYIVSGWKEAFDGGRFARLLDALPLAVSRAWKGSDPAVQPPDPGGPLLRPAFDLLAPIMADANRPAFTRLERFGATVARRADAGQLLGYVDDLLDRKPEPTPYFPPSDFDWNRMRRWIWNKECLNVPANSPAWVIEQYKNRRASEIADDYLNSVTTWDLVGSKQRRRWGFQEFRDAMESTLTKLGDAAYGIPGRTPLDAMFNILKYFQLPDNQTQPTYGKHFHRSALKRFLLDRANDYRLIRYFYPGEDRPRVRLVSSIDRLELVLTNADFFAPWPFGIPGYIVDFKNKRNFGMYFLGTMADAWGDEPRAIWPQEIEAKYQKTGKWPPTLAEAVKEMKKTTTQFANMIGYPLLPTCRQTVEPTDPLWLQKLETSDPVANTGGLPEWFPGLDVPKMQAMLFNVTEIFPVLEDNLPGTGTRYDGGMRILRDMFYELYYTTPEAYRKADFHDASLGERNNLSIIIKFVRMGLLHEVSRKLMAFAPNDPALDDFFNAIIDGSASPHIKAMAIPLLQDWPNHELLWGMVRQIFGIIDAGDGSEIDAAHQAELAGKTPAEVLDIKAGWAREAARMKQLAFYTVGVAQPLGLVESFLRTAGPVLSAYRPYLTAHSDKIRTLLRSDDAAYLTRALYEDADYDSKNRLGAVMRDALADPTRGLDMLQLLKAVDDAPAAKRGWDLLSGRWDAMAASPDYKALNLSDALRPLLNFFEERGDPAGFSAAKRLRIYAAERMESGELDQMMLAARRDPEALYRVLMTAATHTQDGELKDFFKMVRRSLGETK